MAVRTGLLIILLATIGAHTTNAQTYVFEQPGGAASATPQEIARARAVLALVLYKQQHNLFDHRYLDQAELRKLQQHARISAQGLRSLTKRIQTAAVLSPVDDTLMEQLGRVISDTTTDAKEKTKTTGLFDLFAWRKDDEAGNRERLYEQLSREVSVVQNVSKGNVAALRTVDNMARGIERERRLEREKELSRLNRLRLQILHSRDADAAGKAQRQYEAQARVVAGATAELRALRKSRLRGQTAIRFFQQVGPAFKQFDAATKQLSTAHRFTQDLSGTDQLDRTIQAFEMLSQVGDWGIGKFGKLNHERLTRDKNYVTQTLLDPRFGSGSETTYLNTVLQRMPYDQADAKILERAWQVTAKAKQLTSQLRGHISTGKSMRSTFDQLRSEYDQFEKYRDVQTAQTADAVFAFARIRDLLLAIPNQLKSRLGVAANHPAVQILKYAGNSVGLLPTLVEAFSKAKLQRDQFTSLPIGWTEPTGRNVPFLKSRHVFLNKIGLAAYSDLSADGVAGTVFIPVRGRYRSDFVKLEKKQFARVLKAMSVFTTLAARNPTQDEFLALCESVATDGPSTSRSYSLHYMGLSPDSLEYFSQQEIGLTVGKLLGRLPDEPAFTAPQYADRYGGRIVELSTMWTNSLRGVVDGFEFRDLLAVEHSLLTGWGPKNPQAQLRFRTMSRRYDELNELFQRAYGMSIPQNIADAILLQKEGESPLEKRLRSASRLPRGDYFVDVQVSQPSLRRLEVVVASSAPRDRVVRRTATTVEVTLPGEAAPRTAKLTPTKDGHGRNVLIGSITLPTTSLVQGRMFDEAVANVRATVDFDGTTKSATNSISLQTLLLPASPIVSPDLESGSYDSYRFETQAYHHPDFRLRSGSECDVVLRIKPLAGEAREIRGSFRYDRTGESLTEIARTIRVSDQKEWPPGAYRCRFEFRFGDESVSTPYVPFEILDLTPIARTPDEDTDNGQTKPDDVTVGDPTGPLRAASMQARGLANRARSLFRSTSRAAGAVDSGSDKITAGATALSGSLADLRSRIAEVQGQFDEIPTLAQAIHDAALKTVEARQAAGRAATEACAAADRARLADSKIVWSREVAASNRHAAKARSEFATTRTHATAALRLAGRVKSLLQKLEQFPRDVQKLRRQVAKLQRDLTDAQDQMAAASEDVNQLRSVVADLTALKQRADGLLVQGRTEMNAYPGNSEAAAYTKQLVALHQGIAGNAKRVQTLPEAASLLVDDARPKLNVVQAAVRQLLADAATISIPLNPHRLIMQTALAEADVAEVWIARAAADVERAEGCAGTANDITEPLTPEPDLSGAIGALTPPSAPAQPDADLSGALGALTPAMPTEPAEPDLSGAVGALTPAVSKPQEPDLSGALGALTPATRPVPQPGRQPAPTTRPPKPRTPTRTPTVRRPPTRRPTKPAATESKLDGQYRLYMTKTEKGRRIRVPAPLTLTWKTRENGTVSVAVSPVRRLSAEDRQGLQLLGFSRTNYFVASPVRRGTKVVSYVIRDKAIGRIAQKVADIGAGIGAAVGSAIGDAASLGLGGRTKSETPKVTVSGTNIAIRPTGRDLSLTLNFTVRMPRSKSLKESIPIFAKRISK